MSIMSKAYSDASKVDLEKGLKAAATTEEEEAELGVVNPGLASCITVTLDVFVVAYTLIFIGMTVWMIKVSDNWWDPWPGVLSLSALLLWAFWMTPKVKDGLVQKYAMKHTVASDSDVSTNLLASKK